MNNPNKPPATQAEKYPFHRVHPDALLDWPSDPNSTNTGIVPQPHFGPRPTAEESAIRALLHLHLVPAKAPHTNPVR